MDESFLCSKESLTKDPSSKESSIRESPAEEYDPARLCPVRWPRAIILMDMNAFFASIEQLDRPEWRGRPVAITNGRQGTCIITSSYEARAYGIKTGMRLKEARQLCPELIQCPANPKRYASVSTDIMQALTQITPDIEVFSVDEAFLDVSHCQALHGSPVRMGHWVKQCIQEVSGLHCSVGISGDKTTAKYAAKLNKPNGFTVIPPWEAAHTLHEVPVTELCGIASGIGNFLAEYGVHSCGDMKKLPISILAQRYGNPGRRIWYMAQGQDPEQVCTSVAAPKSIGHGKVLPPNTKDYDTLLVFLEHMSEKVAARLRKHQLQASRFYVGLNTPNGWIGGKWRTEIPTDDGRQITAICRQCLSQQWRGDGVYQVQVTAQDPQQANGQTDLFSTRNETRTQVNQVMDNINNRYGDYSLTPARLMSRSEMPDVIAPAWKPFGHRQTI